MNPTSGLELTLNQNTHPFVFENIERLNLNQGSQPAKRKSWNLQEDILLRRAIKTFGTNWMKVAQLLEHRNPSQCAQRWKRIKPKAPPKRDFWTPEEDELLQKYAQIYQKKWVQIAKHIPNRTSKQVRDRFVNKLNPEINQSPFTVEEDKLIAQAYLQFGSKWSRIVKFLKGRPENIVKNRFYTYIGKHYLNIENPYYVIQHNKHLTLPKEEYDSLQNNPENIKEIQNFQQFQIMEMERLQKQIQLEANYYLKQEFDTNCKHEELDIKCKIEQEQINIQQQIKVGATNSDPPIVQKEEEQSLANLPEGSVIYPQQVFYNVPIPMLVKTDNEFKIVYLYQTYNDSKFMMPPMWHKEKQNQNDNGFLSAFSSLEQQTQQRDD